MPKRQPLSKTVVTEFKIHVADLHMRTKQMQGSQACRVAMDGVFAQGDANITAAQPLVLNNVKRMVTIQAWTDIVLSLKTATGLLENIPCSGLFIMYGQFDEVTVRAAALGGDPVRVTYVYA